MINNVYIFQVAVVRQCLAPFIVLVLGYHAAQREDLETVCLPSGYVLRNNHGLLDNSTETKEDTLMQIKAKALQRNFVEQVVLPLKRMEVTLSEMAAVKAILTLDPHAPGIGESSSQLLTSKRII